MKTSGCLGCWCPCCLVYQNAEVFIQIKQHSIMLVLIILTIVLWFMLWYIWFEKPWPHLNLSLFNPNVAICILLLTFFQGLEKPGIICCLLGCIMPCIPTLLLRSEAREKYNIEGRCKNQIVHFVCASKSEFLPDLLKSSKFSASSETLVPPSAALSVSTARWTNPDLYLIWS